MLTSNKIHKTVKTKFKKNEDEQVKKQKQKQKNKQVFRLLKQEKEDYVV